MPCRSWSPTSRRTAATTHALRQNPNGEIPRNSLHTKDSMPGIAATENPTTALLRRRSLRPHPVRHTVPLFDRRPDRGKRANGVVHTWSVYDLRPPDVNRQRVGGGDAPAAETRVRGQDRNILEIQQETVGAPTPGRHLRTCSPARARRTRTTRALAA
ncbi:SU10 major capsid protein [Lentzea pudingi]|uniref:SU10 major capsid protein n=1 Tax=Lentzea pudingi TaxID=1789439 RepID=UPI00402B3585